MHTHISCDRLVHSSRLAMLALAVWCLSSLGCVGPFAPGFADYETKRDVEKAAADTSIPTASEVGLDGDATSAADKPAATLDDDSISGDEQPAAKQQAAKKAAGTAAVTDEH